MLKLQPAIGGNGKTISIIESSFFFLVGAFNFIGIVSDGEDPLEFFLFWGPFVLVSLMVFFLYKNKYLMTFVYLSLAVAITLFRPPSENVSDFSGSIFFVFSFFMIEKVEYGIFILVLTVLSISLRSITVGDTIPGNMIMIVVYGLIYSIFYFRFFDNSKVPKIKGLSKKENLFIRCLAEGYSQKEAACKMGISYSETGEIVKKIKKTTGCKSVSQILFLVGKGSA